ncbi:MAG: hypothetical protein KH355_09855 [Clostridiales bacterium]|nr:hypothetical protein [Clostridiales bacterium]
MRKKLIGITLLIAMGILTACSQEGSSTITTEAVTENTTDSQLEANTTEQIKTTKSESSSQSKKVKSLSDIDEDGIINRTFGSEQVLAGGMLDGNRYTYSCKRFKGVRYPITLVANQDMTITMNSKFELKKGEAQAYLLTADNKLTKVSDGENSYSLKEGENYLVLAAVDMNGSYESEVTSTEGLQIHQ